MAVSFQRDERERIQLQRTLEAVEAVRVAVETWMSRAEAMGGEVELRTIRDRLDTMSQPGTDLVLTSEKLREAAEHLVTGGSRWNLLGEESTRLITELRDVVQRLEVTNNPYLAHTVSEVKESIIFNLIVISLSRSGNF